MHHSFPVGIPTSSMFPHQFKPYATTINDFLKRTIFSEMILCQLVAFKKMMDQIMHSEINEKTWVINIF